VLGLATGVVLGRQSSPSRRQRAELASLPWTCDATWYETGRTTANGERFDARGLTAATRDLPFGTRLLVTDLYTQRSVVVRVNDRGPTPQTRCIDLTRGAFARVSPLAEGVTAVRIERLPAP
jgi:rare lipoprotein A